MTTSKIFLFCAWSFASLVGAQELQKYRVWVDGIFDLAHYGHQRSFEKARQAAAEHFGVSAQQIQVVVGVNGGDIKSYKREPVFSLEQRVAQVRSFSGVDEVVSDVPLVFDDSYVEKYQIDLVMHGDDYTENRIKKYYPGPYGRKIFKTFPYEPGISTTWIIKRAAHSYLENLLKQNISYEERESVEKVLKLLSD